VVDSILDEVKQALGVSPDVDAFNADVLMHINSVFSTLNQLGIGPPEGFAIQDSSTTWADFLGDELRLNMVKTYIYLRVRLLFDPPGGSYHLVNSLNEQLKELEWRISTFREGEAWTPPPMPTPDPDQVQYVPIPVNNFYNAE
jgi:hypothetical protein